MTRVLKLILFLPLVACQGDHQSQVVANKKNSNSNSRATVVLAGMDYHSQVKCSHFSEDHFYFTSDDSQTSDTNGDGLVVTGHQNGEKMILTLITRDATYSAANLGIQKRRNTAMGAGMLVEDGGQNGAHNATYKVVCE